MVVQVSYHLCSYSTIGNISKSTDMFSSGYDQSNKMILSVVFNKQKHWDVIPQTQDMLFIIVERHTESHNYPFLSLGYDPNEKYFLDLTHMK